MGLIVTLIFSILKLFLAFVGLIANIIIKILPYIFKDLIKLIKGLWQVLSLIGLTLLWGFSSLFEFSKDKFNQRKRKKLALE